MAKVATAPTIAERIAAIEEAVIRLENRRRPQPEMTLSGCFAEFEAFRPEADALVEHLVAGGDVSAIEDRLLGFITATEPAHDRIGAVAASITWQERAFVVDVSDWLMTTANFVSGWRRLYDALTFRGYSPDALEVQRRVITIEEWSRS